MREIKFRAWDNVGYMMDYNDIKKYTLEDTNNPINLIYMQFTGLKDCNLK